MQRLFHQSCETWLSAIANVVADKYTRMNEYNLTRSTRPTQRSDFRPRGRVASIQMLGTAIR